MFVASEEATSGSVIANAERISAFSSGCGQRLFCSGVPKYASTSMLPMSGAEQFSAAGASSGLRAVISASGAYYRLVRPAPCSPGRKPVVQLVVAVHDSRRITVRRSGDQPAAQLVDAGQRPAARGVQPASFARYGGDLVAPGESSGRVFAIGPDGSVVTLVVSGLPHGGDIGVESAGFVPPGFSAGDAAYLADRFSKGNRHPGTDSILRLPGQELISAGVRAGDLLVATEASARTIVVRCASSCTARYIAAGPAITHAEGHIAFTSAGR